MCLQAEGKIIWQRKKSVGGEMGSYECALLFVCFKGACILQSVISLTEEEDEDAR